ncbi:MAG: flagellar accessory protein FlaH [Thaumarchaeota archaeon]|nr:flagellar accessory protein FlaH [Candidatus Geocrenenecus arthurdayi]MCL7403395.1 flagellar accessory protein FlaH [Candidatus Geocrenenecus arthurdayi]
MSEKSSVARYIRAMNPELDRKIGELRIPFLCLIEGPNDSGKSVLTQQYVYGALKCGFKTLYITTESGIRGLLKSMDEISLSVTEYYLKGLLQIYELHVKDLEWDEALSSRFLELILNTIKLREYFDLYVIDSLTYLVTRAKEDDILNFFTEARNIIEEKNKSIIITVHPYAFNEEMLVRMRSISDVHFILQVKEIGDRIVKLLQVPKLKGAVKQTSITLSFDVDPAFGIKVLPFSRARA